MKANLRRAVNSGPQVPSYASKWTISLSLRAVSRDLSKAGVCCEAKDSFTGQSDLKSFPQTPTLTPLSPLPPPLPKMTPCAPFFYEHYLHKNCMSTQLLRYSYKMPSHGTPTRENLYLRKLFTAKRLLDKCLYTAKRLLSKPVHYKTSTQQTFIYSTHLYTAKRQLKKPLHY